MRFSLTVKDRDTYQQQGYVEFTDILPQEEVETTREAIEAVLDERGAPLDESDLDSLYRAGRDLWRTSSPIAALVLRKRQAEIASELTDGNKLRLGYDQLIVDGERGGEETLDGMSPFQSTLCGLFLLLSGDSAGNGLFVNPTLPLEQLPHIHEPESLFLLIAYCNERAIYTGHSSDIHSKGLKRAGYVAGDRLSHDRHPLFRI